VARVLKLGALLAMAGIATFVPIRQVAACDCALRELPQAIAEADVAIVGTLAGMGASEGAPGWWPRSPRPTSGPSSDRAIR
jgi:hypothetical protein